MAEVDAFSEHRNHLIGVAYRMLGSRTDAEDAVQEAWLRYAATDIAEIIDLRAWLTTVTARICLDQLRSARVRRETYVGPWLPEPVVRPLPGGVAALFADPVDEVTETEDVSIALMVVLERLSPEQRVAFVLHEAFAVPFDEIARILATTPAAARQLGSRARRAVAAQGVRHSPDRAQQRAVLQAFLVAAGSGDIDGLLAVLAPDVVVIGDGGGVGPATRVPIRGALQVARFIAGLFRQARRAKAVAEPVLVNGDLGMLVDTTYPDGRTVRVVMAFAVAEGRITAMFDQLNPEKLSRVPAADPTRALVS